MDSVQPGYAGGTAPHPSYEFVETGTTGYAETVNITYDPKTITYRDLVHVLLTVRNPTTPDKQGPDEGPQYRSVIWDALGGAAGGGTGRNCPRSGVRRVESPHRDGSPAPHDVLGGRRITTSIITICTRISRTARL